MSHHDEEHAPEPSYDPWEAVVVALDAGRDPLMAHDEARLEALGWFIAVSGGGRVEYLREYEKRRPKRTAYWREYKRRRRAAVRQDVHQPSSERGRSAPKGRSPSPLARTTSVTAETRDALLSALGRDSNP